MTTLELEIATMKWFGIEQNLIVPCVTDRSLLTQFEIDILSLSKAGYASAVELKISKADLKNDLKKNHIKLIDDIQFNSRYKNFFYKNIQFFYYAVPKFLQEDALNQIPSFAGLLVCNKFKDDDGNMINIMRAIRSPKVINKTKWTDKMRYDLARLGAMRILNLKSNIQSLKK